LRSIEDLNGRKKFSATDQKTFETSQQTLYSPKEFLFSKYKEQEGQKM